MRKFSIGFGIALFLACGQATAFSHSSVIETKPLYQSTIQKLPEIVSIRFSEKPLNIEGKVINSITVVSPTGKVISAPRTRVAGEILSVRIRTTSPEIGSYGVRYRMASADGHVISGNYLFSLVKSSSAVSKKGESTEQNDSWWGEHFFHSHRLHIYYSLLVAAVAGSLLLWRRRAQSR